MIDVFLIAGQSNAVGQGDSAQSPQVPTGQVLQYYGASITDANDPVGNANTGSAWPTFGLWYNAATQRKVLFVPAAMSGSAQSSACDPTSNWDLTGALFAAAVVTLNSAMAALVLAGETPNFCGVLWDQGQTDGGYIYSGTVSSATVKTAMVNMIARFRALTVGGILQTSMPFYVFRVGANNPDTYAQMRALQDEVVAADPYSHTVFRDGVNAHALGYLKADNVHYNQAGLNYMGAIGAANVISALGADGFQPGPNGSLYWTDGPVLLGDGSALAPALAFLSALDMGIFNLGSNTLGLATQGAVRAYLNAIGFGIFNTTESTNTGTGSIVTAGGIGVAKSINAGGQITGQKLAASDLFGTGVAVRTVSIQHGGDSNDSSTGSGSDHNHDLNFVIPANALTSGKALRVTAHFKITTGAAPPNILHKLKLGSTTISEHTAGAPSASIANDQYALTWVFQATSAPGASANIECAPVCQANGFANAAVRSSVNMPVTVATNGSLTVQVATQWSAAGSGTNTVALDQLLVEVLN